MSVYYKFNSELNYSHVGFDGLHISVIDLKKAILHQKRLGKTAEFDLLISNAQTKEEYIEDDCLIPKNTSLIVARVPISTNQYSKKWDPQSSASNFHGNDHHHHHQQQQQQQQQINSASESMDLSKMNGSEEDKIQAMIAQSTLDYDPTNYQRVRGFQQIGEVPQNYRCHRCHKTGHWIKNCPMNPPMKDSHHPKVRAESKKMTGIPRSLRENPTNVSEAEPQHQHIEQKQEIPEELFCSICKSIFKDAVMIPCCGSSFCDECIRTALLESDEHECPDCSEKGTSPNSLIPNRFIRNAVASFHSDSNSLNSSEKQLQKDQEKQNSSTTVAATAIIETTIEKAANSFPPQKSNEVESKSSNDTNQNQIINTVTIVTAAATEEEEEEEINDDKNFNENDTAADADDDDDEEDDDDNIIVTVPSASQQSGAEFRVDTSVNLLPLSRQDSAQDYEHPLDKREREKNKYNESSGYFYNSPSSYETSTKPTNTISNSFHAENMNVDKDRGMPPMMNNSQNQNPYHPQGMYNAHPHHGNMHMPPHRQPYPNHYHQSGPQQQQQHQSNYYPQQPQNLPMRYEGHRNFHDMNKHHHHNHPHHHHHPMHTPMNDNNFGMRYQPSSTNLANLVTQNIQQRFGTGIIDDPLEAFNKIMREKEMRKDRFKRSPIRSRSPLRQYSPDRQKSPIRRRKRTRSFSSNSSYSRSRSRSFERHFTKDNYSRDNRKKHRSSERRKSIERNSRSSRQQQQQQNKQAYDEHEKQHKVRKVSEEATIHQQENNNREEKEKAKAVEEPSKVIEEIVNEEPPPPGEENCSANLSNTDVKSSPTIADEKRSSSDEMKHTKKSREKKKHKKEVRSRKKKKRDRKEKKSSPSRSNTPDIETNATVTDENDQKEAASTDNEQVSKETNVLDDKYDILEPELSKWERDEILNDKSIEINKDHSDEVSNSSEVTSDIIKRAENVIFAKAVNAIRPVESIKVDVKNDNNLTPVVKKIDGDKKYDNVHVPVHEPNSGTRSTEIKSESKQKNDAPRVSSIKDRLGKKVERNSRSRSRENRRSTSNYSNEKKKNYQLSSCISSVSTYSDKKKSLRRSRSPDNRSRNRRYQRRSKSRSPRNRNDHHHHHDRKEQKPSIDEKRQKSETRSLKNTSERDRDRSVDKQRERKRSPSYSPKKQLHKDNKDSDHHHEKKRSRSRSRSNKKKRKKEKKTKKQKSRDRK